MFVEITINGINSRFSQLMSEKLKEGVIFRSKKGVYLAKDPFYIDLIEKSAVKYGKDNKLKIQKQNIPDHIAIEMINRKKKKKLIENEVEIISNASEDELDRSEEIDLYVENTSIDITILKKLIKVFIEKEISIDFEEEEIKRILELNESLKSDENGVDTNT